MSSYYVVNNNKSKGGGVLLLLIIVAAFFIMYNSTNDVIRGDMDYDDADMSGTFSATMYGYDEDGNKVSIIPENAFSAFRVGDNYVTELGVGVWWTSEGLGIDWSTFVLTGSVDVYYLYDPGYEDYPYYVLESSQFITPSEPNNPAPGTEFIFVMGTDICLADHIHVGVGTALSYWDMKVEVNIEASVYDDIGLPLSDSISFEAHLTVYWDAYYDMTGGWDGPV